MKKKAFLIAIISGLFFLTSCITYYIPLDSFKQQFAGIDSTKFMDVTVKGPSLFIRYHYKANPITTIKCVDKENKPAQLTNSPSIEVRITYGYKKKRAIFYFDRIYVSNKEVIGVQSRFVDAIRKTIPLDSITKIEVQDGQKKFSYINK